MRTLPIFLQVRDKYCQGWRFCYSRFAPKIVLVAFVQATMDCSKQELVMEMINGAMAQALDKLEERGLLKVWQSQWEAELAELGLAMSAPDEDGNRRLGAIQK